MRIKLSEYDNFKAELVNGLNEFIWVKEQEVERFLHEETEYLFVKPILMPLGMVFLLDYLDKKQKLLSNVFVIDADNHPKALENALKCLDGAQDGFKMTLLVMETGHWRTAYLEVINNINHIAVFDSLGTKITSNPIESTFNSIFRKRDCVLYRAVNKLQMDRFNCGIFALKTATNLSQEINIFEKLKQGNLLLTKQEAEDHFEKSYQPGNIKTNQYFILPPQYFSQAQRRSDLSHYTNEFGNRVGVKDFSIFSKKSKDSLNLNDLFNRKHRENVHLERIIDNPNISYFSNKYVNIILARNEEMKILPKPERDQIINSIKSRFVFTEETSEENLVNVKPKF